MKQFYVYTHSDPSGVPFYVGKGQRRRAYDVFHRSKGHKDKIEQIGRDNIKIDIFKTETEADAYRVETDLIANLKEFGFSLVNKAIGGKGGPGSKRTPEQIAKARQVHIGRKRSLETCMRISRSITGRKLSEAHRTRSAEVLKEISDKAAAWHASPEGIEWHKENGKRAWENRVWSTVTCQEIDCGKPFETPYPTRAKFCCGACKQRTADRNKGKVLGPRRKYGLSA